MAESVHYNFVDILAILFLIMGLLRGLKRGLSGEIARLAGVLLAVWAGWRFYEPLGERIFRATRLTAQPSRALAFFAAVAIGYLLMLAARLVLRQLMEFTFKGRIERVGGALCGLLKAAAAVAAVIIFMGLVPSAYLREVFAERSLFGRAINTHLPAMYADLSERYPKLPRIWPEDSAETEAGQPPGGEPPMEGDAP
ncbi:MAG: CvpA family protein [Kiritimatiellae bacterium]|nr:CvpA family protein [Kiritimatiellia bacterium]